MADAGVGVFIQRKKHSLSLSFVYMKGEGGGGLCFCLFSIQKFIARRWRKRVLQWLLLLLTKWHIGVVEEMQSGCVSVDPDIVTN